MIATDPWCPHRASRVHTTRSACTGFEQAPASPKTPAPQGLPSRSG
jgi:hypothetical protein